MAAITTIHGDMDESLLIKREDIIDNKNERTIIVEYCLNGCNGSAHETEIPDSPSHFCSQHVHRSVNMTLKKNVSLMGAAASF